MRTFPQQLREAWAASGLTLLELINAAGLDTSEGSMSRKLRGEQVMTTKECQAIADALRVTLVWVPEEQAS